MEANASVDLARTRAAFDSWRSTRSRRSHIPDHLWQQALALLTHYSPARVARELSLSPTRLKQLRETVRPLPAVGQTSAPPFLTLNPADLSLATSRSSPPPPSDLSLAHAGCRLQIERADGSRLTLSAFRPSQP